MKEVKKGFKNKIFIGISFLFIFLIFLYAFKKFVIKDNAKGKLVIKDEDLRNLQSLNPKDTFSLIRKVRSENIGYILQKIDMDFENNLFPSQSVSSLRKIVKKYTTKIWFRSYENSISELNRILNKTDNLFSSIQVALPKVGDRVLPSIAGNSVSEFTGKVNVTYPFDIPKPRGRISLSLALNYSSATIDDLRLNHPSLVQMAKVLHKDISWFFNTKEGQKELKKAKPWDVYQYGASSLPYGLGWSLTSSLGVIHVDPSFDNEYILTLNGENIRIKYDPETNSFSTYPKNKLKIERISKLGAWRIIDNQGTVYIFGNPASYQHDNGEQEPSDWVWEADWHFDVVNIPKQSANEYTAELGVNYNRKDNYLFYTCKNRKITAWYLSYIEDVFGNKAKVIYQQDVRYLLNEKAASHPLTNCGYTAAIYPKEIKYNWDNKRKSYLTRVIFNYQKVNIGNPYDVDGKLKGQVEKDKASITTYPIKDRLLKEVKIYNDSKLIKSYQLDYKLSFKNSKLKFDCIGEDKIKEIRFKSSINQGKDYCDESANGSDRVRQWLLSGIKVKGYENQGNQKPTTYCYTSMRDWEKAGNQRQAAYICSDTNTDQVRNNTTPNDIYLVKVDNGYGGMVEYTYTRKSWKLKTQKDKGLSENYNALFNPLDEVGMVDNVCSNTPWLDLYLNNLEQEKQSKDVLKFVRGCTGKPNNLRYLESKKTYTSIYLVSSQRVKNTTAEGVKVKETQYIYKGQPQALAASFYPADKYGFSKVAGFKFLGFPQVKVKAYDKQSGKVYTNVIKKTYLTLQTGSDQNKDALNGSQTNNSCVMMDPRYGGVYESLVYDQADKLIGKSSKEWVVTYDWQVKKSNNLCYQRSQDQARLRAYVVKEESDLLGKANKKEYVYDFQVYPSDKQRNWGNVVKTIDWGDLNQSGDEVYTYVKYMQDRVKQHGQEVVDKYLKANLVSLAEASFTSDENKTRPDDVPRSHRYNWQVTLYDQSSNLPDKLKDKPLGLVTEVKKIVKGLKENDNKEYQVRVKSNIYNQFGLVKRIVETGDKVSDVYYDSKYHMYPICQVVWKLPVNDKRVVYNYPKTCNFNNPDQKLVKVYGYKGNDLDRGLVSYVINENQARSEFSYDEYGRVVKVFGPDPKQANKTYPTPITEALYFDNLSHMVTRVKTRNFIPTQGNGFKTHETIEDSFYDGIGNLVEKVVYGNTNKDNQPYISVFYQQVNANNQVINQYKGVVITKSNLVNPGNQPRLISFNQLKPYLDKPTAAYTQTNTTYDYISRPIKVITFAKGRGKIIKQEQRYRYNGYVTDIFDAKGNQTKIYTDGLGRTIKTVSYLCSPDLGKQSALNCTQNKGQAVITQTKYHPGLKDKVIQVVDTDNKVIETYIYNNQGMILTHDNVDRGKTSYVYNQNLYLTKTIDAKGNQVINEYDQLGRVIKVKVRDTANRAYYVTQKDYDDMGKKAMGRVYQTKTWVDNMPSWVGFLNGGVTLSQTQTSYDLLGNVVSTRSKLVDVYDGVVNQRNKSNIAYLIDTTNNDYSPTGLLKHSQKQSNVINTLNQVQSPVFDLGYTYDDNGRLVGLKDSTTGKNLIEDVTYDIKDRLQEVKYGNQVKVAYQFDNATRLINKVISQTQTNTTLFNSQYVFNLNNQLVTIVDKVGVKDKSNLTNRYYYDSLGRLVKAEGDEVRGEYMFGKNGNILKKDEVSNLDSNIKSQASQVWYFKTKGCVNNEYQQKIGYNKTQYGCPYHAPKKAIINGKTYYYLYDKKGNLVKEFNQEGRVVKEYKYEIPVVDLPTTISVYDPNNPNQVKSIIHNLYAYPNARLLQMVKDNQGQIRSITFYAGWYQKERYTNKNNQTITKETIFYPTPLGRIVKQRQNQGVWQTYFVFTNHQSSTALVTDGTGNLIPELQTRKQLKYLPYGLLANPVNLNNLPTKQTYTNQYFDEAVDLYYYNARFYNPFLGTFVSADPVQDGLNRYMYVAGNPVMIEDPSGTCPWCVGAAVGFIGGVLTGGAVDAATQYVTTGHVDWGQVAVSAAQAGAEGACVGATMGVGAAGLCTGVGAAAGFVLQTAYNLKQGEDMKTAVVESAKTTAVSTAVGLGTGMVGRWVGSKVTSSVVRGVRGSKIAQGVKGLWSYYDFFGYKVPMNNQRIVLYKGLKNGWNGVTSIVPGGVYPGKNGKYTTNLLRGDYLQSVIQGEVVLPWMVIEHGLFGWTGESYLTSWTSDLNVARMYAGEKGVVVQAVFEAGEVINAHLFARRNLREIQETIMRRLGVSEMPQGVEVNLVRWLNNSSYEFLHFGPVSYNRISIVE